MRRPRSWTHTHRPRARQSLLWGGLLFAAAQLLLAIELEVRHPEDADPEFRHRLATLRTRLEEAPNRPVLLVMGSSRLVSGFQPERLPELRTDGGVPVVQFNFSHYGAGPVMNLMQFRRLLRHGVRPQWLVLELMPPFLCDEGFSILTTSTEIRDLPVMKNYVDRGKLYGRYLRRRLLTCVNHRGDLYRRYAPFLAPRAGEPDDGGLDFGFLGGTAPSHFIQYLEPDRQERALASSEHTYFSTAQRWNVSAGADRALRETLDLSRRYAIQVVLLLTPESTCFRSWYTPEALDRLNAYCHALSRRYEVRLIDARAWLPDPDFWDGHHVVLRGADAFSLRLYREVFQPVTHAWTAPTVPAEPPREDGTTLPVAVHYRKRS